MTDTHPDFVTVCKGMGFFASHWSYDNEDGFYCPWATVGFHRETADEAEADAKAYAEANKMQFKAWTRPYRTLEEADEYAAIYRELMNKHVARIKELRRGGMSGPDAVRTANNEAGEQVWNKAERIYIERKAAAHG